MQLEKAEMCLDLWTFPTPQICAQQMNNHTVFHGNGKQQNAYLRRRSARLKTSMKLAVVGSIGLLGVEGGVVGTWPLVLVAPLQQAGELLGQLLSWQNCLDVA